MTALDAGAAVARWRIEVWGAVQGVGFRPFVYRLATDLGLTGFVVNSTAGAAVEVEGPPERLGEFLRSLTADLPDPGYVAGLNTTTMARQGSTSFEIRDSDASGAKTSQILPDLAPCPRCLSELNNPDDRRYRYPFINCTHCGPRYSIITGVPYDRPLTSMADFVMCEACRTEYENPMDRRFHAQPIACPDCGPAVELVTGLAERIAAGDAAIRAAADLVLEGKVLAMKGIGGFHLIVDARSDAAVDTLRQRKGRESKPLAVMVPNIDLARSIAELNAEEEALLQSASAPIVICPSRHRVSSGVSPENANIGLMLPSSPLHELFMNCVGIPVVATSGNRSDEPICIDNREALNRLGGIADAFFVHNRPIVRPIDDSVCRRVGESIAVLRRARGYAPRPFPVAGARKGMAAFGAHLKNSVAIGLEGQVVVGQHIGDLDNLLARDRLREELEDLCQLYDANVQLAVHDLHPDYASTVLAKSIGCPTVAVQHHVAHAAALKAEHGISGDLLAVVWDGTGLGTDRTIWGGEVFAIRQNSVRRVAHLRPYALPGGDAAARRGDRSALGLLFAAWGESGLELARRRQLSNATVESMLRNGTRCVPTTSAGRLFDGAAAIGAGITQSRFEGDAAMRWEAIADLLCQDAYPFELAQQGEMWTIDWAPALCALAEDPAAPALRSARFHRGLANAVIDLAKLFGIESVGLTGGCFQNQLLARWTREGLQRAGHTAYEHTQIPPNDGGIAFGQLAAVSLGLTLE